jgi:hypothetical protein
MLRVLARIVIFLMVIVVIVIITATTTAADSFDTSSETMRAADVRAM